MLWVQRITASKMRRAAERRPTSWDSSYLDGTSQRSCPRRLPRALCPDCGMSRCLRPNIERCIRLAFVFSPCSRPCALVLLAPSTTTVATPRKGSREHMSSCLLETIGFHMTNLSRVPNRSQTNPSRLRPTFSRNSCGRLGKWHKRASCCTKQASSNTRFAPVNISQCSKRAHLSSFTGVGLRETQANSD